MNERPTPETDDAARKGAYFTHGSYPETCGKQIVHIDFARKLERERDEALAKLSTVYRWIEKNSGDGFIDSQTHVQNLQRISDYWYDRLDNMQRERDEAREQLNRTSDELYEEQQNHGITKGHLTECRMEANDWWSSYSHVKNENKAMREAIKEAKRAFGDVMSLLPDVPLWCHDNASAALAKLDPFLTDKT